MAYIPMCEIDVGIWVWPTYQCVDRCRDIGMTIYLCVDTCRYMGMAYIPV